MQEDVLVIRWLKEYIIIKDSPESNPFDLVAHEIMNYLGAKVLNRTGFNLDFRTLESYFLDEYNLREFQARIKNGEKNLLG